MKPRDKIVVRSPNWLGDCIMATPMLRRLRELNPDAHIAVLGIEDHRAVFEGNPNIDGTMLYDSLKMTRFLRAASDLRDAGFDLGYILPNSISSALLFTLGRVKKKIGYDAERRNLLLDKRIAWPGQVEHRTMRYLRMVDNSQDVENLAKSYNVEMHLSGQDHDLADELLGGVDTAKALAMNPCSITPTRRWFPERFAQLADRIHEEMGFEVVLVGGPSKEDSETCAQIEAMTGSARVTNLAGKTRIKSLAAVLGRLRLLVTCNTGTMHIASTAGTPMVILTGSSDITVTAPWGVDYRLIHKNLECYPCWKNECPYNAERPECMEAVTADDVFKEVARILEGS